MAGLRPLRQGRKQDQFDRSLCCNPAVRPCILSGAKAAIGSLDAITSWTVGWKEPVEFMHHCSTKWATYLMSLKSLVETGKGEPNPNDVNVSGDWPD